MQILELHTLTSAQIDDLLTLMRELDPTIPVTAEMLQRVADAPETHLFAAVGVDGHILGCASLCVYDSPTGRKVSVEDVVVGSGFRGQGIGRALMEEIIGFARRDLAPLDLHLTSRPERVARMRCIRSWGLRGGGRMGIG